MKDIELREHLDLIRQQFDTVNQRIESVHAEVKLARAETRDVESRLVAKMDSRMTTMESRLIERIDHLRDAIAEHFEVLELRLDEKYLPRN